MKKKGMFWNNLQIKNLTVNPAELVVSVDGKTGKAQIIQVIVLYDNGLQKGRRRILHHVPLSGNIGVEKAEETLKQYSLEWMNRAMEEYHEEFSYPISEV